MGAKNLLLVVSLVCLLFVPPWARPEAAQTAESSIKPTATVTTVETQLVPSVDNATVEEHTSIPSVTPADLESSKVPLKKVKHKPQPVVESEIQVTSATVSEAQLDSSFVEVSSTEPVAEGVIEPSSDHANVSITEQQLKTDLLSEKGSKKSKLIKPGPSIDIGVPIIPVLPDLNPSDRGDEGASNATAQQGTDAQQMKLPPDKAFPLDTTEEEDAEKSPTPVVPAEESKPVNNQSEEIPSFNEWAQKQLAEAEKKKVLNASELPKAAPKAQSNIKIRSKNYASPDCGAKIVGANPEAQHASAVLSSSQDEYALSPCNCAKIWFVVELCEAIQAKQIELANYELFSSSPQEFTVLVSDRYPTRDWHSVGHFVAQDERTVQSFNLEPFLSFGKFIKVEMHSHYGKEHFCPVSLFRAYGTSELEVLEDEGHNTRPGDDDDGYDDVSGAIQPEKVQPKNLFGSATEAVISIVKKAAQAANVFAKSDSQNSTAAPSDMLLSNGTVCSMSPKRPFSELCPNCTPGVLNLVMCNYEALHAMLSSDYVLNALHRDKLCLRREYNNTYLGVMLTSEYITALCRIIFSEPLPPSLQGFYEFEDNDLTATVNPTEQLVPSVLTSSSSESSSSAKVASSQPVATLEVPVSIQPSQTTKPKKDSEEVKGHAEVVSTATVQQVVAPVEQVAPENVTEESSGFDETESGGEEWTSAENGELDLLPDEENPVDFESNQPASQQATQAAVTTTTTSTAPVPSPAATAAAVHSPQQSSQQKESVFVRLANRIKALERNMSLSAQYLEELSKRYKKQVDDMQKAFERTLAIVTENSRQAALREQQQAEKLNSLEQRFSVLGEATAVLLAERESWQYKFTVLCHNIVLICAVIYLILHLIKHIGVRSAKEISPDPERRMSIYKRHLSADDMPLDEPTRKRRNSEREPEVPFAPLKLPERPPLKVSTPKHDPILDKENKLDKIDPYKKKRKRLRKELRGMSVQDLCSGLSPGTLAMIRAPSLKVNPKPMISPIHKVSTPKCRRHSTDNSIADSAFWKKEFKLSDSQPEKLAVFTSSDKEPGNLTVELIQPEEAVVDENVPPVVLPKKSSSGLKKMVKKLF